MESRGRNSKLQVGLQPDNSAEVGLKPDLQRSNAGQWVSAGFCG